MLSDLTQFIGDLLDNWAAFMTGGIPVAILAIWERWRSRNVSFRFYIALLLGFGFAAASFQTWRHEHSARIQLVQSATHSKERNADIVQHLRKYYSEASNYHLRAIAAIQGSDDEFSRLDKEVDVWSVEVGQWFLQNMGEPAYHRILQQSGPSLTYVGATPQRNSLVFSLSILRDNLGKLVESAAWDKQ